ncbi:hypothetical protein [Roseateles amylovorans]|uniref:Uncharacterized protein n=1 Tax=Roseateles amylovorans TaxID=2978473 RepID=A0ABY6AWB9_9BURK|nr:hypothetical protein [Roseateles amylovorans]UXH77474.1 hypothetical protein N4261_21145 [Roseateles amylovorans]
MKTLITVLLALSAFALQAFARSQGTAASPALSPQAQCVAPAHESGDAVDVRVWRLETLAASEETTALNCAASALQRRCTARS